MTGLESPRAGLAWEGNDDGRPRAPQRGRAARPAAFTAENGPDVARLGGRPRRLAAAVRAWVLAVGELARDPRDAAALAMVETTGRAVQALGEIGRRWVLDEAVLEAERARAWQAGYDACRADRCRLAVIDGGQAR